THRGRISLERRAWGRGSLRATSRRSPRSLARKTTPCPPRPISSRISKRRILRAAPLTSPAFPLSENGQDRVSRDMPLDEGSVSAVGDLASRPLCVARSSRRNRTERRWFYKRESEYGAALI